jgi:DNA-binding transcriptional regulator YdaS (Cro superfamily)
MTESDLLRNIYQVIARGGGQLLVAQALGISKQAVHLWIQRRRIPPSRIPALEIALGMKIDRKSVDKDFVNE